MTDDTRTIEAERRLRAALRAQADVVTTVRPLEQAPTAPTGLQDGSPRRRTPWVAAAAAAAVVVAGAGAAVLLVRDHPGSGGGAASCAFEVRWEGRVYSGIGEQARMPEPGRALGTGVVPGCDDGNGESRDVDISLHALDDRDPAEAVVTADGEVLAPRDGTVPADLRELLDPEPCRLAGPTTVRATALDFARGAPPAPYTLTLAVDAGDGLPMPGYTRVVLPTQVTSATAGGDDEDVVGAAVQGAAPIEVRLACRGDGYAAASLRLAD